LRDPAPMPHGFRVGSAITLREVPGDSPDDDDRVPAGTVAQLPTRAVPKWTPESVDAALAAADTGNLQLAADLVETIMTTDPYVVGVLSTRTLGMLRLQLAFKGGSQAAREALAGKPDGTASGEWWTMHPESELAQLMGWGIVLGVGWAQRVPLPRETGARQLHRIEAWHPRWFFQDVYSGLWRVNHRNGVDEIHMASGQWVRFTPQGHERPWARGAWRALAFAWIVKQFALHDRARFSEVFGTPVRVGTSPEGATERMRTRWLASLKSLGRDSALVLPPGYDLKLVAVGASQGGVEVFEQQIQWADRAIAVALAGQIVTTEGTPGFSSGAIHETIKADIIGFTAAAVSTTLHEQSVRPWAALGFGSPADAPVPQWDTTLPEDQERKAAALRGIGDAIGQLDKVLSPSGVRVDAMRLAEQYGIPTIALPITKTKAPNVQLAPTDVAKVVRVDEARAAAGLGPLGTKDGQLTVSAFAAAEEARIAPPAQPAPGRP